ncbi:MAG: metal ABC transporter permease [Phycisphaerales bacterium]|nr:metal ABC transporter permease [Phycisphaerales bacterium]
MTTSELVDVLLLQGGRNTTLVVMGTTLLGVAAGLVGVFALLRRRSLMADTLSHAALPGIAGAFLVISAFGMPRSLGVLLLGATVAGVLGVLAVQGLTRYTRLREDAAMGIVLSVFFGVGIVMLSVIQNRPGAGQAGLKSFIYGQTAAMSPTDAVSIGVVAVFCLIATLLLQKEFVAVCFQDEHARSLGWPVGVLDLAMMALVVIVTVVGLQSVGVILIVAMLIIPPAAARLWTDRVSAMLWISALIGGMSGYSGACVSALFPRKPAGSVIVLCAGALFLLSLLLAPRRGVLGEFLRRIAGRVRLATDHALESLYEREIGVEASPPRRGVLLERLMALRGLVVLGPSGPGLTEKGRERGARLRRNHLLWEQYLISHADVAPSHVDWSVDQVEHVLSEDLVNQLERALASRGVAPPTPAEGGR